MAEKSTSNQTGLKKLLSTLKSVRFVSAIIIGGIITFSLELATLIFHVSVRENRRKLTIGFMTPALIATFVSVLTLIFNEVLLRSKQYKSNPKLWNKRRELLHESLFLINLFSVICCIVNLALLSSKEDADGNLPSFQTTLTTLSAVSIGAQGCFTILFGLYAWWPVYNTYQAVLLVCAVLQYIVATLIILVNSYDGDSDNTKLLQLVDVQYKFCPHLATIIGASAFMGFGISVAAGKAHRLTEVVTRFIRFYILLTSGGAALSFAYICISFDMLGAKVTPDDLLWNIASINPGLSVASFALCLIGIVAASKLQTRPKSTLQVEVYDLSKLSESQFSSYSQLIDRYSKQVPGAPSGANALSLMNAYKQTNIPGMECLVLRVFRPDPVHKHELDKSDIEKQNVRVKRASITSYEEVPEWINLDREMVLPLNIEDTRNSAVTLAAPEPKLSKNQLKRLQKKQMKGNKSDAVRMMSSPPVSLEDSIAFEKELMSTEAFVLITKFSDFDLTSNVGGRFGRILTKCLGGQAKYWKPLCINLGLVGFHWPFRESTFYCSPTKRPVARSAAVLRAITQWNHTLPKSDRFTVFLNPVYQHEPTEQAFIPSGWTPTPLPATHIIDLRAFGGKSLNEYLKAIKYRNQSGTFVQAGGEVIESKDFTDEECETALRLWSNIAQKRTGEGHHAVLATPQQSLFKSLGQKQAIDSSNGHRSLLFLKVEGKVVASCVLFRLGDTITSDLQGLDHEMGRKYKAYFVMMQKTIEIALSEGIKFVDFGPTTSKPKMDIGCKSVPLMGGMYSSSFILSKAIAMSAKHVNKEQEEV